MIHSMQIVRQVTDLPPNRLSAILFWGQVLVRWFECPMLGLVRNVLMLVCLVLSAMPAVAEKRIALVVGIDRYASFPEHLQLKKAVNDARSVSAALMRQGFKVETVFDPSRLEFVRSWQRFLNQIEKGDIAALFFAGHGVEIHGQNYLLPADMPQIQAGEEEVLKAASMSTDRMLEQLQRRGARLNLIILDACRDNPFASPNGRSVGTSRGLGHVQPASGTFIMYSAGIGQSALDRLSDNDQDANSVYTRELLPLLNKSGLSLLQVATRVRRRVRALALEVNHHQVPAYYDEVIRDFYLAGKEPNAPSQSTDAEPTQPTSPPPASDNDKLACQKAILDDTLEAYESFLHKYPNSACRARIQNLYAAKVEKIQWDKARAADTISAYRGYLIAYSNGVYAGQAKDRLTVLSKPETPSAEPASDAFQELAGYDIYGGDYRQLRKISINRCSSTCERSVRCRAFTYNTKHRLCFLKDAVGTLMPYYDAVSAVRASDLQGIRPSRIRVFENRDVPSFDYRSLRNIEFLTCYQTCEADGRCRSFAYVQRSATCWLKTHTRPVRRQKGVMLGIKE